MNDRVVNNTAEILILKKGIRKTSPTLAHCYVGIKILGMPVGRHAWQSRSKIKGTCKNNRMQTSNRKDLVGRNW